LKLKFSLIVSLLFSILVPLVFGFYFLVTYVSEDHKERVQDSLEGLTQIAKLRILSSVDRMKETSALVTSRTQLRKSLAELATQTDDPANREYNLQLINKIIYDASISILNIVEISLYDKSGKALVSTLDAIPADINPQVRLSTPITLTQQANQTLMLAFDPLLLDQKVIGLIKVSVRPSFIQEIVEESRGLGETGEWIVAIKNTQGNAVIVSPTRYDNKGAFNRTLQSKNIAAPIVQALAGNEVTMWDGIDYAGNEVVAATRSIAEYEWGIIAKINKDEVFRNVDAIAFVFWFVLAVIVLIALLIGAFLTNLIVKPIENLTNQLTIIRDHRSDNFAQKLNVSTVWVEVALLAQRFNEMLDDIRGLNEGLNHMVNERTAELAATNEKLTLEKHRAETATHAKSLFLANMSHELRTPLNSIYGALQLLAREPIPDKSKNLVTTASYSMESLLGIINDILDFSKIEDDSIEFEKDYFSFTHIAKQVVAEMQVFADKQGLALTFKKSSKYQEGWLGDALRIKQILVNFVSNAIKFTVTGSVIIEFDSQQDGAIHYLIFTVKDTGIGMSQEVIDKLFDRFSQADSSITRKFGGTGLGMPISLGLVKMMGGQLDVVSKLQEGSRITTKLPLEKAQPQVSALTTSTAMLAPNLEGKTILLAEDNEINQVIFSAMLEDTKATIILAADGQEALALFKKIKPDIVFLDIQMPVMDGIEACKAIRTLSPTIPLVSITANISTKDTRKYESVGFNHHVGKPVNLHTLFTILSHYV